MEGIAIKCISLKKNEIKLGAFSCSLCAAWYVPRMRTTTSRNSMKKHRWGPTFMQVLQKQVQQVPQGGRRQKEVHKGEGNMAAETMLNLAAFLLVEHRLFEGVRGPQKCCKT